MQWGFRACSFSNISVPRLFCEHVSGGSQTLHLYSVYTDLTHHVIKYVSQTLVLKCITQENHQLSATSKSSSEVLWCFNGGSVHAKVSRMVLAVKKGKGPLSNRCSITQQPCWRIRNEVREKRITHSDKPGDLTSLFFWYTLFSKI